ncbi:helix-turn-helix domain-containing protein [Patescibacteria group bacterium]|nr:helix-turn-helix domain-containing protein [Patescibacteria group bacterium]MCL5091646.1 helix-turn-helix domain-containing protein [Patescibacteria group bacterium]
MLSVGKLLQTERLRQHYTLADVEKAVKVRSKFIEAIEKEQWQWFSSKIYITGIIKNYARFLGLDGKRILAFFRREYEKNEEVGFKKKVATRYLTPETKRAASIGLAALLLTFFLYFAFQLKTYLSPPQVTIMAPQQQVFHRENRIKIVGKTETDAIVTISGERVYQNQSGVFEYNLPLAPGKNTLQIQVVGANGKTTVIKRDYVKQ